MNCGPQGCPQKLYWRGTLLGFCAARQPTRLARSNSTQLLVPWRRRCNGPRQLPAMRSV
jgi:hypothetical protein